MKIIRKKKTTCDNMVENLKIEGIKDYPIKWICNFRGQKLLEFADILKK